MKSSMRSTMRCCLAIVEAFVPFVIGKYFHLCHNIGSCPSASSLLHLEERYRPRLGWSGWLARFGVSLGRSTKLFRFNDYSVVLQAAIEGQGVALGWRHLVDPLVEQGLLLRPVPQSVTTDQPIYIVASRRGKLRAEAVYLRDWLVAEAQLVARS